MHLNKKDFIVVIPARLKSGRLPGKPLKKILGIPMVIRTYAQCLKVVSKDKILIATDDNKIKKVCESYNANVIMTSKKCLTGTDRVAEVSKKIKTEVYINVQGDEPLFSPNDIKKLIKVSLKKRNEIITGYTEIKNKNMFFDINVPKVVINSDNNLIYASRAPIPFNKKKKFLFGYRQVCAYAFPRKMLKLFSYKKKKTKLENVEDIEYLRFLEMGVNIKCLKMSDNSIAVDTPHDLKKAIQKVKKNEKIFRYKY